jgi:hypothetical protein
MELVVISKEELQNTILEILNEALADLPKPEAKEELPEWLTRQQVAEYLSCSLASVDNYSRRGFLNKVHINGLPRFHRDEVKKALEALK